MVWYIKGGGDNMKRPVATIEEPDGHICKVVLPYYLHENADIQDAVVMVQFVCNLARVKAGDGIVIDIEWMGEEEL